MRKPVFKGVGFGLTSGVITTLGVIVGLESGTGSKLAVIAGILVLALADSLSDALGIHVSEEAEGEHTSREVWEAALYTLFSKAISTPSFLLPVLLLEPPEMTWVSAGWGILLITLFSSHMAKSRGRGGFWIVVEHIVLTVAVVVSAHYLGELLRASLD